jgi:hypothetical protein
LQHIESATKNARKINFVVRKLTKFMQIAYFGIKNIIMNLFWGGAKRQAHDFIEEMQKPYFGHTL